VRGEIAVSESIGNAGCGGIVLMSEPNGGSGGGRLSFSESCELRATSLCSCMSTQAGLLLELEGCIELSSGVVAAVDVLTEGPLYELREDTVHSRNGLVGCWYGEYDRTCSPGDAGEYLGSAVLLSGSMLLLLVLANEVCGRREATEAEHEDGLVKQEEWSCGTSFRRLPIRIMGFKQWDVVCLGRRKQIVCLQQEMWS
jgi:hypothetical protein